MNPGPETFSPVVTSYQFDSNTGPVNGYVNARVYCNPGNNTTSTDPNSGAYLVGWGLEQLGRIPVNPVGNESILYFPPVFLPPTLPSISSDPSEPYPFFDIYIRVIDLHEVTRTSDGRSEADIIAKIPIAQIRLFIKNPGETFWYSTSVILTQTQ
jgi:hypothetical protein